MLNQSPNSTQMFSQINDIQYSMIHFHAQVHANSQTAAAIMPFCSNEGSPFVEAKPFPNAINLPDTFSNKHYSHLPVPSASNFQSCLRFSSTPTPIPSVRNLTDISKLLAWI
jgi:hypothetical protein